MLEHITSTTTSRERPIIMGAPMVRALLDGRKTQTRRIVKLPHQNPLGAWEPSTVGGGGCRLADGTPAPELACIWHTRTGDCIACPYGAPGDRLWVREAWQVPALCDVQYRATATARIGHWDPEIGPWRPSIHMPRWASRILLEITEVRVERLQEISTADILAEGAPVDPNHRDCTQDGSNPIMCVGENAWTSQSPMAWWHRLWSSLHGPEAWDTNPWVWVVAFRLADSVSRTSSGREAA